MEEKSREQELSVREISLIRELTQIRKEHKRELEYEKFDGYELPPRTQFSMLNKPAVSIKYGVMKFNMACIRLFEGIKYAKAGNHLHQISNAIGAYCEKFGYGVVRDLVGHGVGCELHEDPQIPNFVQKSRGIRLRPGMTLAIEPMVNAGRYDVEWTDDDWTVITEDGSLSAHYENTILITDGDPEILTLTK